MTFTHVPKRELPEIKQIKIDDVRHYETPDGTFISITSLLKNYTPDGILSWRESVGDDVADHVMKTATTRGNKVHKLIENCLSNKPETDLVGKHGLLAAGLFQLMIPALDKIDQIRVLEKAIYSKRLRLAGTEKIDQIVILTVTEDGTLDVHKDDQSLYVERLEEMVESYKHK